MDYNNKQNKLSRRRVLALVTVIVVVFSLYGFRLFQIQIVEGEAYAEIVNRGTSVTMSVSASRGEDPGSLSSSYGGEPHQFFRSVRL